jgi:hypothetical protein
MKATTWKVATALTLALGLVAPLEAQGRGNSARDRDRDDRYEDNDDHRYGDREGVAGRKGDDRQDDDWSRTSRQGNSRYERNERGNGPSFCRSGRGHPQFGWDWCRERGWDRSSNSRYPVRWEERGWDDVIFGRRDDRRSTLDRRGLDDILGDVVFGRIDTRRRELGTSGDWLGRWTTTRNGRELFITAGGIPVARLIDRNGDRRVDSVLLAER